MAGMPIWMRLAGRVFEPDGLARNDLGAGGRSPARPGQSGGYRPANPSASARPMSPTSVMLPLAAV